MNFVNVVSLQDFSLLYCLKCSFIISSCVFTLVSVFQFMKLFAIYPYQQIFLLPANRVEIKKEQNMRLHEKTKNKQLITNFVAEN